MQEKKDRLFSLLLLAGFLAGINPKSREHLLDGLRDFLGEAAKSAPESKPGARR